MTQQLHILGSRGQAIISLGCCSLFQFEKVRSLTKGSSREPGSLVYDILSLWKRRAGRECEGHTQPRGAAWWLLRNSWWLHLRWSYPLGPQLGHVSWLLAQTAWLPPGILVDSLVFHHGHIGHLIRTCRGHCSKLEPLDWTLPPQRADTLYKFPHLTL